MHKPLLRRFIHYRQIINYAIGRRSLFYSMANRDLYYRKYSGCFIPGLNQFSKFLSLHKEEIYRQSGAVPVVCDPKVLSITNDKLMTCKWLEQNRFNYPLYAASEDHLAIQKLKECCSYPLIAKPRIGKGSQGIFLLNSDSDLAKLQALEGYVLQEYVGTRRPNIQ